MKIFNLLFDFWQRLAEASVLHGANPMTCKAGKNRPECIWATAAASNPRDFFFEFESHLFCIQEDRHSSQLLISLHG